MSPSDPADKFPFKMMRVGTQLPAYEIGESGRYIVQKYENTKLILLSVVDTDFDEILNEFQVYYDTNWEKCCFKVMTSIVFRGHIYAWKNPANQWYAKCNNVCRVRVVDVRVAESRLARITLVDHDERCPRWVSMQCLLNLESRFWNFPPRLFPASLANIKSCDSSIENKVRELLKDADMLQNGQEIFGVFPDYKSKHKITLDEPAEMYFFQIYDNMVKDTRAYLIALNLVKEEPRAGDHDWAQLLSLIDKKDLIN